MKGKIVREAAQEARASSPPTDRWKNVQLVVIEAALIVFGVALALAANAWREHGNNVERARLAESSIADELEQNRAAVVAARDYHARLRDTLLVLRRQGAARAGGSLFPRGFVSPATILTTAWDVANGTGMVAHMEYDRALAFSRVYAAQSAYIGQSQEIGGLIYSALFGGGPDAVLNNYANLSSLISTFHFRECELLARYDEILPELGRTPPDDGLVRCRPGGR